MQHWGKSWGVVGEKRLIRKAMLHNNQGEVDQLIAMFEKTWRRPPIEEKVKGLMEDFVREKTFYREALAIGLDRQDTAIRRRMRQKMEFILEDFAPQLTL